MIDRSADELLAGYRRFRLEHWPEARAEYEELAAQGQKPHTLIVACSDSRADPALIFDTPVEQRYEKAMKLLGLEPWMLSPDAGHA